LVAPSADAIVVNVSSPNTPGLRDLQKPDQLGLILETLHECSIRRPVLVKIAPDLTRDQIHQIASVCRRLADGMIATNTTATERGGLSGRPLMKRSTEVLRQLRDEVSGDFPLIGVGGVFTAEDAAAKLDAGADLVQAYTGFVYEGPSFAKRLARGLTSRTR
ncbi:MAG TPA: nitronate monooxygenase, partial [Thermoanaerobaculia bacterium]